MSLSPSHPMHIALGLTLWSAWFVGVYGGLSVACAVAPPAVGAGPWNWLNGALALFTLVAAALLLRLAGHCWQAARGGKATEPGARFVARLSATLYLVAAIAALYVGVPILALPPCI